MDTKEEQKSPTVSGLKFVMKTDKHFSGPGETECFTMSFLVVGKANFPQFSLLPVLSA